MSIKLSGLEGLGYSAKFFRPTGATAAIQAGENPELIMKLGRWKTPEIFYGHYIHDDTPSSLIEATLPVPI